MNSSVVQCNISSRIWNLGAQLRTEEYVTTTAPLVQTPATELGSPTPWRCAQDTNCLLDVNASIILNLYLLTSNVIMVIQATIYIILFTC